MAEILGQGHPSGGDDWWTPARRKLSTGQWRERIADESLAARVGAGANERTRESTETPPRKNHVLAVAPCRSLQSGIRVRSEEGRRDGGTLTERPPLARRPEENGPPSRSMLWPTQARSYPDTVGRLCQEKRCNGVSGLHPTCRETAGTAGADVRGGRRVLCARRRVRVRVHTSPAMKAMRKGVHRQCAKREREE